MEGNRLEVLLDGAVGVAEANGLVSEVEGLISISKDAGLKLGKRLKGMREALKKKKKWFKVIEEIARMTGYTGRTITRWVDGETGYDKMSDAEAMVGCAGEDDSESSISARAKSPKAAKPFSADREIRNVVGRLNSNQCKFSDVAEKFLGRMLEKSGVRSDDAGDAECIEMLKALMIAVMDSRGLDVEVDIRKVSCEMKEAA